MKYFFTEDDKYVFNPGIKPSNLNGNTSYFFYGLIFHFTRSLFRTSIYNNNNNTLSFNHPVKKLLSPIGFLLKVAELLTWLPFPIYLI